MDLRVLGAATFAVFFLLLAAASGQAQMPSPPPPGPLAPQPGFVPPFEIMRTVRAAGFDPVAPPLREGTTYVLRATDFRGILMRVVIDASTGAIRAVNRIVPGPGTPGQIGMLPPYSASLDDLPPYGVLPEFNGADLPDVTGALPPPSFAPRPPVAHPVTRATVTVLPPLPRPRPAEFAARKPADDAKPEVMPVIAPVARTDAKTGTKSETKPEAKSEVTTATPAAVPPSAPAVAPSKPTKPPPGPPIND